MYEALRSWWGEDVSHEAQNCVFEVKVSLEYDSEVYGKQQSLPSHVALRRCAQIEGMGRTMVANNTEAQEKYRVSQSTLALNSIFWPSGCQQYFAIFTPSCSRVAVSCQSKPLGQTCDLSPTSKWWVEERPLDSCSWPFECLLVKLLVFPYIVIDYFDVKNISFYHIVEVWHVTHVECSKYLKS